MQLTLELRPEPMSFISVGSGEPKSLRAEVRCSLTAGEPGGNISERLALPGHGGGGQRKQVLQNEVAQEFCVYAQATYLISRQMVYGTFCSLNSSI